MGITTISDVKGAPGGKKRGKQGKRHPGAPTAAHDHRGLPIPGRAKGKFGKNYPGAPTAATDVKGPINQGTLKSMVGTLKF